MDLGKHQERMLTEQDYCLNFIVDSTLRGEGLTNQKIIEEFNSCQMDVDINRLNGILKVLQSDGYIERSQGRITSSGLGTISIRGTWICTRNGEYFKTTSGYVSESKMKNESESDQKELERLQKKNLELQNDALGYEQEIRKLKEKLLILNLLKEYWWVILTAGGIGRLLAEI